MKESKVIIPSTNKNKKRLIFFFGVICVLSALLALRVGWVQIVDGEEYSRKAVEQQTSDVPISAKRGILYDRNGKELAVSAVTNTIWVRPSSVKDNTLKKDENEIRINRTAKNLAEILEMDEAEVREIITADRLLVRVAKYVDKDKADLIRAGLNADVKKEPEKKIYGIEIAEDVKRYYPLGAFASHLLGSTTDDNQGLSGIELKYNKYLSGIPGRWIKSKDIGGRSLTYGVEKYFQAEDGLNVVLTIDEVIQHYVEKAMDQVMANTQAKRVMCIAMQPSTGEILAMAVTPDFDPNDPRTPTDPAEAAKVEAMNNEEKQEYWNEMWRNPLISDTYEPGSTFKLLTTAIALETGVTYPNDRFVCQGYVNVAGTRIRCSKFPRNHGPETLTEGVQNSCNPVFIALAQRMGWDKYYDGLMKFGMGEKTGVDFPGEGENILQKKESAGPVGLATMSFGQGIAVTPVSLIRAICAIGNGGKLMEPHLVKALTDSDGNVVQEIEPKVVRQVISEQTAAEVRLMMEAVVSKGGGGTAKIMGYRIGGKTATAQKPENGRYAEGKYYSSFLGMAPMDDPQIAVLLIVDEPQGLHYGSQTAAPGVKIILEDVLRYLNIAPQYTAEEQKQIDSQMTQVPNVVGQTAEEAIGVLGGQQLKYVISPAVESPGDLPVVDQYPKAGEKVPIDSTVTIYYK